MIGSPPLRAHLAPKKIAIAAKMEQRL